MKYTNSPKGILIYIVLALAALFVSTKFATMLYENTVVVNGILSAANLYFIYLLFLSRGLQASQLFEAKVELPRDLKYIFLSFFLWIIIYWSARYIIAALLYLWDLVSLGI